jgi:hypothetical protein
LKLPLSPKEVLLIYQPENQQLSKVMRTFLLFFSIIICSISQLNAQKSTTTQLIEGRILDKETKSPIAGAIIFVENTYPVISTQSDLDGYFSLENIPTGRQTLKAQKPDYITFFTDNLMVRSTKGIFLEIEMKKAIANSNKIGVATDNRENTPLNEFSVVSTRSFTVEETQRYPGSIYDPGRMALCFPGIQGYEDNESDMIIRGNSASGVLYRLEGLDLQGVGHFAWPLSANGAISALSISLLSDSDLSTGAFAAEYGNASSGVVDMKFRTGNLNNREYTFRLGLFGVDFATEGPIKRGNSSYLINYRYSTLGILGAMGIYVVRENVNNTFQDLSFNTTFESDDRKDRFQVFGLGGLSSGQWFIKEDTADWVTRQDHFRVDYRTAIGNIGANYRRLIDERSYLKILAGATYNQLINRRNNALIDSIQVENHDYAIQQYTLAGTYSNKVNDMFRIKAGLSGHGMLFDLHYDKYNYINELKDTLIATNGPEFTYWLQGYFQTSFHLGSRFTLNAGMHTLFMGLNSTYSLEPRASLQYQLLKKTRLSLAYGIHGQILPIGTYFYQEEDVNGNLIQPNRNLEIAKAHHAVFNIRQLLRQDMTLQLEFWYQLKFDQPIGAADSSTFFLFNQRLEYADRAMVSTGSGRNYGVDLMFEKAFRNGYFILLSGSLFRSYFTNAEGIEYRTRYDNLFASAFTIGKEFSFKDGSRLSTGIRFLANGGMRYTPADTTLSNQYNILFVDESQPYTAGQSDLDTPFYYRADLRLAYRKDWPNFSLTLALDAQNITNNTGNAFQQLYDIQNRTEFLRFNGGILPVINMQIDF